MNYYISYNLKKIKKKKNEQQTSDSWKKDCFNENVQHLPKLYSFSLVTQFII